jgi:hypothetical protein
VVVGATVVLVDIAVTPMSAVMTAPFPLAASPATALIA